MTEKEEKDLKTIVGIVLGAWGMAALLLMILVILASCKSVKSKITRPPEEDFRTTFSFKDSNGYSYLSKVSSFKRMDTIKGVLALNKGTIKVYSAFRIDSVYGKLVMMPCPWLDNGPLDCLMGHFSYANVRVLKEFYTLECPSYTDSAIKFKKIIDTAGFIDFVPLTEF